MRIHRIKVLVVFQSWTKKGRKQIFAEDSHSFGKASVRRATASILMRSKGMPNLSHTLAAYQISVSQRMQENTKQTSRRSQQVSSILQLGKKSFALRKD